METETHAGIEQTILFDEVIARNTISSFDMRHRVVLRDQIAIAMNLGDVHLIGDAHGGEMRFSLALDAELVATLASHVFDARTDHLDDI